MSALKRGFFLADGRTKQQTQYCFLMLRLPALPDRENNLPWSSNVYQGFDLLSQIYRNATLALQTHSEVPRILFHSERIVNDAIPLLLAFEALSDNDKVPDIWLEECTTAFGKLISDLDKAEQVAQGK